jgi:hypothetical protein
MFYIKNNTQRAKEIIIIFWVNLGISVINTASLSSQYLLLKGVEENPESIDMPKLEISDLIQNIFNISTLVISLLTIVYFIRWFRRAYNNLHQLPGTNPSFTEGWAAGSWFVPILSWFRPFQIMREIWDGTQRVITHRLSVLHSNSIIGIWWGLYLVMSIYNNIVSRITWNAKEIGELITATQLQLIGEAISWPALIVAIVLVRRTSLLEMELWFESQEPSESVFSIANST